MQGIPSKFCCWWKIGRRVPFGSSIQENGASCRQHRANFAAAQKKTVPCEFTKRTVWKKGHLFTSIWGFKSNSLSDRLSTTLSSCCSRICLNLQKWSFCQNSAVTRLTCIACWLINIYSSSKRSYVQHSLLPSFISQQYIANIRSAITTVEYLKSLSYSNFSCFLFLENWAWPVWWPAWLVSTKLNGLTFLRQFFGK